MRRGVDLWRVVYVALMVACGDSSPEVDAMRPVDAGADAAAADAGAPDAGAPDAGAPDAGAPDAEPPDALPPDATPPDAALVVLDSVTTTDGSRQLSQGSYQELVLRGSGLEGATAVAADGLYVLELVSTSPTEVRIVASVDVAHAPGPLAVTVTAPLGTATLPGALQITHVIVSPTGVIGGRGTYDSPFALCDPQLLYDRALNTSMTFELLAGVHVCDRPVSLLNVTLTGAGSTTTIVEARVETSDTGSQYPLPSLRGVTIRTVETAFTAHGRVGIADLAVEDAAVGIQLDVWPAGPYDHSSGSIDGYTYRGPGTALRVGNQYSASLTRASITRTASGGEGCVISGTGGIALTSVTVEGCPIAIDVRGGGIDINPEGGATIESCELIDNAVGIALGHTRIVWVARTTIRDREDTAAPATTGVLVHSGRIEMGDSEIVGYAVGVEGSGGGDYVPSVHLTNTAIDAEQTGVLMVSYSDPYDSRAVLEGSTIRSAGTGVYLDRGVDGVFSSCSIDSGTGFALDLAGRDLPYSYVFQAPGTLLNGHSYAGQLIQGPAEAGLDYRLRDDKALQF